MAGELVNPSRPVVEPGREGCSLPQTVVAWLSQRGIEVTTDTVRNWCLKGVQNKKRPEVRCYLGSFWLGGRLQIFRTDLIVWAQALGPQGT